MEKTVGVVLKSFKYGDTSAIVYLYTQDFGMKSFLIKGFFSPKNKQAKVLRFPFVQVELSFSPNNGSSLQPLYQYNVVNAYAEMHQNPIKLLMLQFLAEVLYVVLKEDEPNQQIFNFIKEQITLFSAKREHFADFHLIFLLEMTSYLGFFPNLDRSLGIYFDLEEGKFSEQKIGTFILNENNSIYWLKLCNTLFSLTYENQFNQSVRQILLGNLLDYYRLHVPGFREPKSLEIIKEVIS